MLRGCSSIGRSGRGCGFNSRGLDLHCIEACLPRVEKCRAINIEIFLIPGKNAERNNFKRHKLIFSYSFFYDIRALVLW